MEPNQLIVIEVSGGNVQNVFATNPQAVKVILVDWDKIEAARAAEEEVRGAGEYPVDTLDKLSPETATWILFDRPELLHPGWVVIKEDGTVFADDIGPYVYLTKAQARYKARWCGLKNFTVKEAVEWYRETHGK